MTLTQIKKLEKLVRRMQPNREFTLAAGTVAVLCRLAKTTLANQKFHREMSEVTDALDEQSSATQGSCAETQDALGPKKKCDGKCKVGIVEVRLERKLGEKGW